MKVYILQIDTATEVCSIALSLNGKVVGVINASEPNVHATRLTQYIDDLLNENAVGMEELSAVAVSMGPGSYTGLRIGVSTAKGLCYALDIPLIGINTLASIYKGYVCQLKDISNNFVFVPMLDARRMEVYLQVYSTTGDILRDTEAVIIDENTFNSYKEAQIVLFGSGANKLQSIFQDVGNITIDNDYVHSASYLTEEAYRRYQVGEFEDLIYFEPYYLKEFVATLPKKLL